MLKEVIEIPQKISYKAMVSSKSLGSFFNNFKNSPLTKSKDQEEIEEIEIKG